MKRFGWMALIWLAACGGQDGNDVTQTPLPSDPSTPADPDGGSLPSDPSSPTNPSDPVGEPTIPTVPPSQPAPPDGGSPIPPPARITECQNSVAATLVAKAEEPILDNAEPSAGAFEFTSARDGTVLFDKSSARKTELPSFELLGMVLDGSVALISDINYASGSRLYTVNAKTGAQKEIALGDLAFSGPALTADRKAAVIAFASGRVLAHNFQSQRTTVLASGFPSEFDYADPPFHQSADSASFLFEDGSGWIHYDASSAVLTRLPATSDARFIGTSRRYRYLSGGKVLGRDGSGASVDLGPVGTLTDTSCGSISEGGNSLLVVGTDGVARLWRPSEALPTSLGGGFCRGVLSGNGAHAALTRGTEGGPFSLSVRNLSSGAEKPIVESPTPIQAVLSKAGGKVAVKTTQANGSTASFSTRVRLFDSANGLEIPLTPSVTADGKIDVAFRHEDRILATVPEQAPLALFDCATGLQEYKTGRSVIPEQGQMVLWNLPDTALFTPVDWYLSDVYSRLFAYQVASNKETAIGDEAIIDCQIGGRAVVRRKMVDPQDDSLPGELVVYNAGDSSVSIASPAAEQATCAEDRLIFRDRPTAVRNQHIDQGRLWSLNIAAGTKTLIAEGTTSYLVRGKQVAYTTKQGVCVADLP